MDNQPESRPEIKPVIFNAGGGMPLALSFDEYHKTITMSPLSLDMLTLADFKRIHTFFRKLEARKFGNGNGAVS